MIIFFINSHPYLHWCFFFFFLNFSITVWLVFPSSERIKSSHPSHDLERVYKYPTFNYTWSYIKKKKFKLDTLQMVICWDVCPKKRERKKRQPLKRKQKEIKEYTLQELANKSIKCLSRCYCGMSVGFHFSCNRGGLLCQEESPTPPTPLEGQRWSQKSSVGSLLTIHCGLEMIYRGVEGGWSRQDQIVMPHSILAFFVCFFVLKNTD